MTAQFQVGDVIESPSGNRITIVAVNGPEDTKCHECKQAVRGKITYDIQWPGGSIWYDMELEGSKKI